MCGVLTLMLRSEVLFFLLASVVLDPPPSILSPISVVVVYVLYKVVVVFGISSLPADLLEVVDVIDVSNDVFIEVSLNHLPNGCLPGHMSLPLLLPLVK